MANLEITGHYQFSGKYLQADDKPFRLVLDQRKNPKPNQPIEFIVAKSDNTLPNGKTWQYISSLYLTDNPNVKRFDFAGNVYYLTINSTGAEINYVANV